MSIEKIEGVEGTEEVEGDMDIETARALVAEDPILRKDVATADVLESGGFRDNGESVGDIGNWLVKRKAALESGTVGDTQTEAYIRNNPDATVVYGDSSRK